MTQPYALFLADIFEDAGKPADIAEKAATELRCLHAELERCKQVCAATSEGWTTDAKKWKERHDALLEALKNIERSTYDPMTAALVRVAIAKMEVQQ